MSLRARWWLLAATVAAMAAASATVITEQRTGRDPQPWQPLDATAQARFDLGHAVFNTSWLPAGHGAGRRDGLGPLFNAPSCDACHNSRRRGRGPVGDGPAPSDLVMQVGQWLGDRTRRGHPRFGHVVNTDAVSGFTPEASVSITYTALVHARPDGTQVTLWEPQYTLALPDGAPLPPDLVLMPRLASPVQGVGLLEAVSDQDILAGAEPRTGRPTGRPAWVALADRRALGRFGWQATEATVAAQTATAFAREMGLTTSLVHSIDCGAHDTACQQAPHAGTPEVDDALLDALVAFQRLEAVRRTPRAAGVTHDLARGEALFARTGCADCHRNGWTTRDGYRIDPGTDLLLHDMGPALADRDLQGRPLPSHWRTAPLWGMSTALEGGRPVRLLHDGRARSLEEAIAWHAGAAAPARARFDALDATQRRLLIDWVAAQ